MAADFIAGCVAGKWVSHGCHMGVTWLLHGCHMGYCLKEHCVHTMPYGGEG